MIPYTVNIKLAARTLTGTLNLQNKTAVDWGWQGLIAQGCHSSILIIDPKTAQTIQVLERHKANVVKVKFKHMSYTYSPIDTCCVTGGEVCHLWLPCSGNVDNAKILHYSALTYRLAKTQGEYNVAHLRLCMTLLAFVALVLSGVFFCQESFVLQHASAIFEWVFCVIIMLFYGTFAFEFASMSGDTMAVLARGGALGSAGREHKVDALGGHTQSHPLQPENMSIL
ncbi:transmembrane protein 150A-like [Solea senegalensis]|uniref:Transmembrane protein 150A-like n=1 Tax=Solea senegalensis TaxID=28829 RepID=A0AAV6S5F4_SOLSE|nr:transmembrane protein 150A-like [Solea senegalensis]